MPLRFHLKVTNSFNIIINTTPTTNKYIIKKIIIFLLIFYYTIISALPLNQLISTIHRNTRQMGPPSLPVLARVLALGSQIPVNLIFYFKQCNVYNFVQWLNFLLTMLCNNPFRMDNSVKYLQIINFSQLTLSEKTEIKVSGRPTPVLSIEQKSSSKG